MPRKFAEITFTPSVKLAQKRYGSRQSNMGFELMDTGPDLIGEIEAAFIEARDGFYQASVNSRGWPYVQFRGGPKGFLKVIDQRTLGYADFRGNVQYLSVGNIDENEKVSLILMDYPNRRRLKIWARAKVVDYKDNPSLVEKLEVPTYRAQAERAVILQVEAMDWNCPKHIPQRFTVDEILENTHPTLHEKFGQSTPQLPKEMGSGNLPLVISSVRQLTPDIRAYELRHPDGADLPKVEAGSIINMPVRKKNNIWETRTYSIASNPARTDAYEIAVKKEINGSGGSKSVHNTYELGMKINADLVRNNFRLEPEGDAILIAGGIGITPIKAMAQALVRTERKFHLHYAGKSRRHMAYRNKLELTLGPRLSLYPGDEGKRLNLHQIIATASQDARFYLCGPVNLIKDALEIAPLLGLDLQRFHFERFTPPMTKPEDHAIDVLLKKSRQIIHVPKNKSILDSLIDANVPLPHACKTGECGLCKTKVVKGNIDHRDQVLSDDERKANLFCPCVSRSQGSKLELDL